MEDVVTLPVWLNNLVAYCLQIAILAAAGTLLAHLFRLRVPRVTLVYWQLLLLACLFVPLLQSWKHPVMSPIISTQAIPVTGGPAISDIAVPSSVEPAKPVRWEIILLIIAAGILLRLMWLAIGFIRLRLFRRKSHLFVEEQSVIHDMQWRTGVRVTVLLSDAIHSPVTFGFRSPTIILPISFKELSEPCKQAVLCHELLHVRRFDWVVIIAEEILCSIFWFHPAIWWLLSRVHLSREQAVDYEVVQLTGSRQPYLDSLLEFARTHTDLNTVPAPLFLREHHLVQRVALLLKEVSMSRSRLTVSMIGISALLIVTVRLAAGCFPLTGSPVLAQEQNSETKALQRAPIRVGANIQESKLIHKVEPDYPERAIRERMEGTVRLTITVDGEGQVFEIRTEPENNPILEEAAVAAVKQWRYSPTLLNNKPVSVMATVKVVFKINGDGGKAVHPVESRNPDRAKDQGADLKPGSSPTRVSIPGQYYSSDIQPPRRAAIRVGGNIQESKLVHKVEPVYPEQARQERLEGTVRLAVTINEEGFVSEIVAAPGNYEVLEAAAIDAVKQWRYSPTYLNGEPVPVTATVTVVYVLRDVNDLAVTMDESGNLSRELPQVLQATGTIRIGIAPATPFRVVENAIRELTQKGVQKIKLSGPFVLYRGQLFYAGKPANVEQLNIGVDIERLISMARASGRFEKGKPYRLTYRLYLNEAGEAVGLQCLEGVEVPEIEQELLRVRQTPILFGSDPVPYMNSVGFYFIG
jgi:TonB family protein